ncbi:MAG: ATP-dependent helicase, partial [Pseudobdellovibrionaceae bacterium]
MSVWLDGLNPEQKEAVLHNTGPLLILAGAGSGKTTVLVSRTGRLIAEQIAKSKEICVLTFTNKAAKELKSRVAKKVGPMGNGLWAGTFHSFGLGILREHGTHLGLPKQFGIIDQGDSQAILRDLLKDIKVDGKYNFDLETLLSTINNFRASGRKEIRNESDEYEVLAHTLVPKYEKKLQHLGVVDFEDLLLKPLKLLQKNSEVLQKVQNQFTQVMVDEFQDTNEQQMKLIELLVKPHKNLSVVGDDDQSIYGWRGACVSNILDFPSNFSGCKVIRLERNYRSTPAILALANEIISKNKKRHGKVLRPGASEDVANRGSLPEAFVFESEDDEVENTISQIRHFVGRGFEYKDIAILYRSNQQGGVIEASLRRAQIPYSITGGTAFFDRREVKDVLAYLRSAVSPNEVSFRRIINIPPRGIGGKTIETIESVGVKSHRSFFESARALSDPASPFVNEIHGEARESLAELFTFFKNLPENILKPSATQSAGDKMVNIFAEMGYRNFVYSSHANSAAAEKRWMCIEILGRVLDSFVARGGATTQTMREFLDSMELRDTVDESDNKDPNKVQLLTLHACKGLEFPVVILLGVEVVLIPHRTLGSDG